MLALITNKFLLVYNYNRIDGTHLLLNGALKSSYDLGLLQDLEGLL